MFPQFFEIQVGMLRSFMLKTQNKEGIILQNVGLWGGVTFEFVFYNFVTFHASNASETFPRPNAMVPEGFENIFVTFAGV